VQQYTLDRVDSIQRFGGTRALFVMLSPLHLGEWSNDTVDECVLLANILWSASQRKLAKIEDKAEGQRLMRLFRLFTIGMAVLDREGLFTAANAAFCRASGYSENHLWMKPFETVFSPVKDEPTEVGWLGIHRAKSAGRQIDGRLIRKDGSSAMARIVVTPLNASADHPLHSLVIIEGVADGDCSQLHMNGDENSAKSVASQLIQCQENERKRLSRELHDDIGQRISLMTSEVALLASQFSSTTSVLGDRLISVRDHLDHLCSDLHCMSHNLHSYPVRIERYLPAICQCGATGESERRQRSRSQVGCGVTVRVQGCPGSSEQLRETCPGTEHRGDVNQAAEHVLHDRKRFGHWI